MFIDENGHLSCRIGNGAGKIAEVSSKGYSKKVWYLAAVTFDANSESQNLSRPVVTPTNGARNVNALSTGLHPNITSAPYQ